ncbi:hypothetical protein HWN40_04620 [Methanolobus zinderi]|uniref:Uncharacterized protein n=1 Tax=Methanolobus zinderi TaxID=536044 RepID=A0A7D5IP39_9EURY|nr:hypothetical protein [Methanolobus zinderi]KXS42102.1 MAG: hypothetical protein AWU59_1780 [Methanolobus sp. T82-4]QLC49587.1 hypothetical protein HWN40_04620 [Methanolobus zinderi]
MFEDIEFKSKSPIYNPEKYILGRNLDEQDLDEDLFQVNYDIEDIRYTIDVGWYPAFSLDGSFRIVVVKNCNWEDFLYDKRTRDYEQLHRYMEECVDIVIDLIDKYEETVNVINQLKEICFLLHFGEIPDGDIESDLYGELVLAFDEICGTLSYSKLDSLNEDFVNFLVSTRLKNLTQLSEQINIQDYPQMHLNYLMATYTIKLLEKYYYLRK